MLKERLLAYPAKTAAPSRHRARNAGHTGCSKPYLASGVLLLDGLDDTDSHSLAHVTDGKASQRRVGSKGLHAHGLGGGLQHVIA